MDYNFITVEDGIVTYSGTGMYPPENAIILEESYKGAVGVPLSWLHEDYTPKSEDELVVEGLKELPPNSKIEDGKVVPYTEEDFENLKELGNAERRLAETDWYIVRYIDNGTEIPIGIKNERQELRKKISKLRDVLCIVKVD